VPSIPQTDQILDIRIKLELYQFDSVGIRLGVSVEVIVISRLDMYHTNVLMYCAMILWALLTMVKR
jgi:hypothetical protein